MSHIEHDWITEVVLAFAEIVGEQPSISDDAIVARLVEAGLSRLDAEKVCVFCPSAFAWATLHLMGLRRFPSVYVVYDRAGRKVEVPLSSEHIFTAALVFARDTLKNGWSLEMPRHRFEAVAARSWEINATNQLLAAGKKVSEATFSPLHALRFTAEEAVSG